MPLCDLNACINRFLGLCKRFAVASARKATVGVGHRRPRSPSSDDSSNGPTTHRAPTHSSCFAKLKPLAFSQAFGRCMASACETTGLVPIAIGGKSARRAKQNTATGCLHIVSAWATESLDPGSGGGGGRFQQGGGHSRVAQGARPQRGVGNHRRGRLPSGECA